MKYNFKNDFHYKKLNDDMVRGRDVVAATKMTIQETKTYYNFFNHFHPYVGELIGQLNKKSLAGLFDVDFQSKCIKASFLFSISNDIDGIVEKLNNGQIPEEVNDNIDLSDSAEVEEIAGNEWKIDGFFIKKEKSTLNIYKHFFLKMNTTPIPVIPDWKLFIQKKR